jgi:hypothetical protein
MYSKKFNFQAKIESNIKTPVLGAHLETGHD